MLTSNPLMFVLLFLSTFNYLLQPTFAIFWDCVPGATFTCDPGDECHYPAQCNSKTRTCPKPVKVANGEKCIGVAGHCINGKCIKNIPDELPPAVEKDIKKFEGDLSPRHMEDLPPGDEENLPPEDKKDNKPEDEEVLLEETVKVPPPPPPIEEKEDDEGQPPPPLKAFSPKQDFTDEEIDTVFENLDQTIRMAIATIVLSIIALGIFIGVVVGVSTLGCWLAYSPSASSSVDEFKYET